MSRMIYPSVEANSLWEQVNKTHQKLAVSGFGEWETCPVRPLFSVCRIREDSLIQLLNNVML